MFRQSAAVIIVAVSLACAACEGSDGEGRGAESTGPVVDSYAEGSIRMEIEYLDTGLLKGHAYADASEGWRVASIAVSATDSDGDDWIVIEPPGDQVGFGSANASEFFEVRLEELPRGQQITVTQTATFESETESVKRQLEDRWPP
jgi:hypothetical protein